MWQHFLFFLENCRFLKRCLQFTEIFTVYRLIQRTDGKSVQTLGSCLQNMFETTTKIRPQTTDLKDSVSNMLHQTRVVTLLSQ